MARSLNKVTLIGNLTRDPELRYTPQGTAVCSFGLATNRQWSTETGEKKEDVEFHRVVAWNKLAEICSQLLAKGRKVYIEGRLQTRNWTTDDNQKRSITEVIANEMILLDSKGQSGGDFDLPDDNFGPEPETEVESKSTSKKSKTSKKPSEKSSNDDTEDDEEEIPF